MHCARCGLDKTPVPAGTLPGELGDLLSRRVCTDCWNQWREMEVRVINELRLNFMEPSAQATLERHMREFLGLADGDDRSD